MHRTWLHFLDDIREAVESITTYTAGMTYEQFLADKKTQDAVVRNFEIIGEAIKNLPEDLKARYPSVAWKRISGLRDVISHGYFRVDNEVIWGLIAERIPGFKTEMANILAEETRREKESRT